MEGIEIDEQASSDEDDEDVEMPDAEPASDADSDGVVMPEGPPPGKDGKIRKPSEFRLIIELETDEGRRGILLAKTYHEGCSTSTS
jgi:hypothetical protein